MILQDTAVSAHVTELKQKAQAKIDSQADELVNIARSIFNNPETRFQEYSAAKWLCEALTRWGFQVERGVADLETAFRATHQHTSSGPTIAFVAEYDALPELGHACGHNLIAGAGLGALLAFQDIKDRLPGTVTLLGSPGEEGGGGKITMLEAGIFEGVAAVLMFHPSSFTAMNPITLALSEVSVTFQGKSSHAAESPEKGINALQGLILTFNAVNTLRESLRNDARIHGIITDGGIKPTIIPETASADFVVRAGDSEYCHQLVDRLRQCARGAALATGAMVSVEEVGHRKTVITNQALIEVYAANWTALGGALEEGIGGAFSTDMGQVSHAVPSIHPAIAICPPGIPLHSREFAQAANSSRGYATMIQAAKALVSTAIEFLADADFQKRVEETFAGSKDGGDSAGPLEAPAVYSAST